ncbi:MAG: hypothetical protein WCC53_08235 [Thermoanaerobaculia bacterium]
MHVTVTRTGHEEHVLRLEAEAPVPAPAPAFFRYLHETPEFHLYANMIHALGGDPEKILRGWLEHRSKIGVRAGRRIAALVKAEREQRRKGGKVRGAANETHRKKLFRALRPFLPTAKLRRQILAQLRSNMDLEIVVGNDGILPRVTVGPYILGPPGKKASHENEVTPKGR